MPSGEDIEVKFAQRLAGNTKSIRDKAVKKLKKYLSLKSQKPGGGFNRDEMLKIWKGLFYCMWMSDKPLVQEELSQTMGRLIHDFQNIKASMLFFETFFATMNREWQGIDRLRMDKFYLLVRNVFQEGLILLKKNNWEKGLLMWWIAIIKNNSMNGAVSPNGLAYHIADIYFEELTDVGHDSLKPEQVHIFLEPYGTLLSQTKHKQFVDYLYEHVFEEIIESSEVSRKLIDEESANIIAEGNVPMGEKFLKINYKALADMLLECSKKKNVGSYNSKKLYDLVKIFRGLSEGRLPLDNVPDLSDSDNDEEELQEAQNELTERLIKIEEDERKKKHTKQKKKSKILTNFDEGSLMNKDPMSSIILGSALNPLQYKDHTDSGTDESLTAIKLQKKRKEIKQNDLDSVVEDNYIKHLEEKRLVKKKKMAKKRKMLSALLDSDDEEKKEVIRPINAIVKSTTNGVINNKQHKVKLMKTDMVENEISDTITNSISSDNHVLFESDISSRDENKFATFETNSSKPVASFFRKAVSKANKTSKHQKSAVTNSINHTPKVSSPKKRVSFQMSKIQVQPFRKNDKSICVSPSPNSIAFDPTKKPNFSLLKPKIK